MVQGIRQILSVLFLLVFISNASACIWDDLAQETGKKKRAKLADLLFSRTPSLFPDEALRKRLAVIESEKMEEDPLWHNNVAGIHLRLGEPEKALTILTSAVVKFPQDYGVLANLGSAYTLLGKYDEAEKAIRSALESTNEHHYAEEYHLALLQYLNRPLDYQKRHVYVDEFSVAFLRTPPAYLFGADLAQQSKQNSEEDITHLYHSNTNKLLLELAALKAAADTAPPYREKWNLAKDARWYEAIVFLAASYPKEPACFTMAGVASLRRKDYKSAIACFDRAVLLGSPQVEILRIKNSELKQLVARSFRHREVQDHSGENFAIACVVVLVGAALLSLYKQSRKKNIEPAGT